MKHFPALPAACFLLTFTSQPARATGGDWLPPSYLEGDGRSLKAAPEFFWELEIARLAKKYRDKDSAGLKRQSTGVKTVEFGSDEAVKAASLQTAKADLADFEDALKSGRFKPADAITARLAHSHARTALDEKRPLPGREADSEFADYHAGAAAPLSEEASVTAWKKLLARPKEQRHYRSVWAAFMLGKRALNLKQWADAVKSFEECRTLVREGFADSLGLAADSYGWQARAELMAGHHPQAARLYLTQLALGDDSAVVSLKRLIPEWVSPSSGGLPGEPIPEEKPEEKKSGDEAAEAKKAEEEIAAKKEKDSQQWLAAARDPVLQELVTAHVLATNTGVYPSEDGRARLWLDTLNKAGIEKVEDAPALAWVAYAAGDYKASAGWLNKASDDPPLARWLKAKLALRDGKFAEAAKLMEGVDGAIPETPNLNTTALSPAQIAHADAGALRFANGDYPAALDAFRKSGSLEDLIFMVESIMTTEELIQYATTVKVPPKEAKKPGKEGKKEGKEEKEEEEEAVGKDTPPDIDPQYVRSLIGRRLVREGRVKESRAYLDEFEQEHMDKYIGLVLKAEDKKTPAAERAKAWWEAGVLMKEEGHQFRGTEEDAHRPTDDGADYTVRTQRLSGKYSLQGGDEPAEGKESKSGKRAVFIPATADEKKRLAATAKHFAKAMRTRVVGSNHLVAAAALLPNGSEEKARALNTAGWWLQDIDNPAADKIYSQIEKTCSGTVVGKAVIKKHWFLGETNPFNKEMPEE